MFGLRPRVLPTFQAVATGVGGETKFIKSAEVPTGIKWACGTAALNVVKPRLPSLLPMSFGKRLGKLLDSTDQVITWKSLGGNRANIMSCPVNISQYMSLNFPPRDGKSA